MLLNVKLSSTPTTEADVYGFGVLLGTGSSISSLLRRRTGPGLIALQKFYHAKKTHTTKLHMLQVKQKALKISETEEKK